MKRVAPFSLLVILISGQTCAPLPATTDKTASDPLLEQERRLVVNNYLRMVCRPLDMTDNDVSTMLLAAEANRLLGYSWAETFSQAISACGVAPDPRDCQNCMTAIVNRVYYGRDGIIRE